MKASKIIEINDDFNSDTQINVFLEKNKNYTLVSIFRLKLNKKTDPNRVYDTLICLFEDKKEYYKLTNN